MSTKILKCKCESEFQDKTYGNKNRLHNLTKENKSARCTVCGDKKLLK